MSYIAINTPLSQEGPVDIFFLWSGMWEGGLYLAILSTLQLPISAASICIHSFTYTDIDTSRARVLISRVSRGRRLSTLILIYTCCGGILMEACEVATVAKHTRTHAHNTHTTRTHAGTQKHAHTHTATLAHSRARQRKQSRVRVSQSDRIRGSTARACKD